MKTSALLWGLALLAAGASIAGAWIPGSDAWTTGPRVGIAMTFLVLGLLTLGMPLAKWFLIRNARPGDYVGGCPVGATCLCGHFNFKPRRSCRACGKPTVYSERPA